MFPVNTPRERDCQTRGCNGILCSTEPGFCIECHRKKSIQTTLQHASSSHNEKPEPAPRRNINKDVSEAKELEKTNADISGDASEQNSKPRTARLTLTASNAIARRNVEKEINLPFLTETKPAKFVSINSDKNEKVSDVSSVVKNNDQTQSNLNEESNYKSSSGSFKNETSYELSQNSNLNSVAEEEKLSPSNQTIVREPHPQFGERTCRTVHFAVLVAPDFDYNPKLHDIYIMFGHAWLGNFKKFYYPMNFLGYAKEDFAVLAANIGIPVDINKTEYKYLKILKNRTNAYEWEYLHHSLYEMENRFLDLTRFKGSEAVYRFDNCIQPKHLNIKQSRLTRVWNKFTSAFTSRTETIVEFEKINGDSWMALKYFWPDFSTSNGFYVKYNSDTLDGNEKMLNAQKTIILMDEILFCFSNSFYYKANYVNKEAVWSIASDFFQTLLSDLNVDSLNNISHVKRVEIGCVALHLAFQIAKNNTSAVTGAHLVQICNLFVSAFEKPTFNMQLKVFDNNNKKDRKKELRWLIDTLILDPNSLIVLPLYNSLIADDYKYSDDITDVRWWLPHDNKLSKHQRKDFDWSDILSVLAQCSHYPSIDEHFVPYVLAVYCHEPLDVLKISYLCSPNIILSWLAFRINEDSTFIKGKKCLTLIRLLEKVKSSVSSSQKENEKNNLPELIKSFYKITTVLLRQQWIRIEQENVQFLLKLVDLADFLIDLACYHTKIDKDILKNFLDSLRKLLTINDSCFRLDNNSSVNHWQGYVELLLWKGKNKLVTDVWITTMKASLEKPTKKDEGVLQALLKFYCSEKFDTLDERLRTSIENIVIDFMKTILKREKAYVVEWLQQMHDDTTNGAQFSRLVSMIFVRTWPKKETSDFNILLHLLKLSFLNLYFDKNFISSSTLSEECQKLLFRTKEVIMKYKEMCMSLKITLGQFKMIVDKVLLVQVVSAIEDNSEDHLAFEKFIDNLVTIENRFVIYQNQMKILSPFMSRINLKEKAHISDILAIRFDDTSFSRICTRDKDNSLTFGMSLPEDLANIVPVFESLQDNNFFNHFWRRQCKMANDQHKNLAKEAVISSDEVRADSTDSDSEHEDENDSITFAQVIPKIYQPTIEKVKQCFESLKDLSMPTKIVDELLTDLPEQAVSYLPDELRAISSALMHSDNAWVNKFKEKLLLYLQLKQLSTTNDVFQTLLEKLNLKQALDDLNQLSFGNENRSNLKLSDIHLHMIKSAKKLKDFPLSHLECLDAVNNCWDLIEWARQKDESDLPRFVEIASTNFGESDADIAMITDFNNVIIGFNCLIFNMPSDLNLDAFFERLNRLWESLSRNPNLDKQLIQSYQNLIKLDDLWKASGDMEKTSLRQIENINQGGLYKIGDIQRNAVKKKIDNCIELEFSDEKENVKKVYNLTELRDLHSRVMLIGTQMDKGLKAKKEIEDFAQKFDGILRLVSLYVKHYEAGNMLFIEWKCFLDNDPEKLRQASCCLSADGKIISGENDDKLTIFHQIDALCSFFEGALTQWNEYLEKMRDKFPELNHFTNRQIEYLRRALARIDSGLDPKAATMLLVLDSTVTPTKIVETTLSCLNSAANSSMDQQFAEYNDEERNFIQTIIDYGFDKEVALSAAIQVNFSDIAEALTWCSDNMEEHRTAPKANLLRDMSFAKQMNELVDNLQTKQENLLASKLESLWCDHILKNESNNYTEFLGVHQLGSILRQLAQSRLVCPARQLHVIKMNEPNLLLSPSADLYRFVLGLYGAVGGPDYLPSFEAVLMCSEETTVENISLFVRRLKLNNGDSLFTMVDVAQLTSSVCTEMEMILEDLKKSGRKFYLALVASEENFSKSPAANYLSRFTMKFTNPSSWMESKNTIQQLVLRKSDGQQINLVKTPPEFCLTYFKNAFFTSVGYGHGKSRIVSVQCSALPNAKMVKIPVHYAHLVTDDFYLLLKDYMIDPSSDKQRIFHVDVLNHQTTGVDKMLFQLFVLGGFTTSDGDVWRSLPNDLYAVEMTSGPNQLLSMQDNADDLPLATEFRFLLPTVLCQNPLGALKLALEELHDNQHVMNRSLDEDWINDDSTQRCYQYLTIPKQTLDQYTFVPMKNCHQGSEILRALLTHCGVEDPSWSELQSFVNFLNFQLVACEGSPFCHVQELPGFKSFVVKFMIQMSRDFSTRSLQISEDVGSLICNNFNMIEGYQVQKKQKWEHKAHPYLFFNEDGSTFSFFGCNLTKSGDLIDPTTGNIIETQMASPDLVAGLVHNVKDLLQNFDDKTPLQKIGMLCTVLGVSLYADPDNTYVITSDCALKMMAIKMRLRCGIPVVIMGETGCGKTKLIEYLCDLERNYYLQSSVKVKPQNLIIVRVHGGTTKEIIENEVKKAVTIAKENYEKFKLSTVLFFDEANATPAISLIKEIMCDGTMNGKKLKLKENFLNLIAAVNPYRKHTDEMIHKLETSGLGYHVNVTKITEKFGNIPLRQLVYRVHPLPPSMLPLVWDFGTLTNETESLYINKMVNRFALTSQCEFPHDKTVVDVFANILTQCQSWMRLQTDEASFVSLRNVERALKVTEWFYSNRELFFTNGEHSKEALSVLLSICVCYRCSVQSKRKEFDDFLVKHFCNPLKLAQSPGVIGRALKMCQETFLDGVNLPANIAINEALRENVFMMTLCIELRIPLFLIGKPGSSKSLAKTVVAENMIALSSKSRVYPKLKQAALVSYQCSPLATADGVETIFRQCARLQKNQNLEHYVAAAIFDEIGLAEDSPALPLKALHGLLEIGCSISGEALTDGHRVAFVGISNWALDPAKMNRGIFVTRIDPSRNQLFETAKRICNEGGRQSAFHSVEDLIHPVIESYLKICEAQDRSFFGLRDFYSVMKSLYEIADQKKRSPKYREVINAVRHNFSGQENPWALKFFEAELVANFRNVEDVYIPVMHLIEENLRGSQKKQHLNRYLLVLTENYAAMRLLKKINALSSAEIIFGSSFPQDLEYTQICRNINKIKVCMDKGRTVILLNLEQLYESLYDLLNQAFIQCSGENFVDLGLGTHRLKCHVHQNFRLVIVAEREEALNRFPLALLNRLEKHYVSTMQDAENYQKNIIDELKAWAVEFSDCQNTYISRQLEPADAFIGYHDDTATAIIGEICDKKGFDRHSEEQILQIGKEILLQSSTPDAILRLRCTPLKNEMDDLIKVYFKKQSHASFQQYLEKNVTFVDSKKSLHQVTTHSQLFSHNDNVKLSAHLGLEAEQTTIVTIQMFNTEHEFQKRIRNVLQAAINSPQLLVVQCLSGDQCPKLIAGCRYLLENMIKADDFCDSIIHIFLLINLPRVSGGCFKGFPSIQWQSCHIDELEPHANEIDDLTELIGKSVSTLLNDFIRNKEEKSINFDLIVKESLQIAASYIRDDTPRKLERLDLLQRFWKENGAFRDIVYIWLHNLLVEQEEHSANASDWMFSEASKTGVILENRTYKQALCKFIENLFLPLLSGLLTIIDNGNNLNLLLNNVSSQKSWTPNIWLKLFADKNFMKLRYNSSIFVKKNANGHLAPRQDFTIFSELKFPIQVPFFWIMKNNIDDILSELERTANRDDKQLEDQAFELLKETPWGLIICQLPKPDFAMSYVHDYILSFYNFETETDLTRLIMMWIAEVAKLDVDTKAPVLSCALVHRRLARNVQLFIDIVEVQPSIVGDMMKSTDKFNKCDYALDLLSIEQLLKLLDTYMEDVDTGLTLNLLTKRQKENRLSFITLFKSASKTVKAVFKNYDEIGDSKPTVQQLLQRLKTEWFAAELCASFLYHTSGISFPLKVKALWKDNKGKVEGLNSTKFWKGLETLMKIWTQQLFGNYFRSAKLICVDCGKLVSIRPIVLPCGHVIHEKCFNHVFNELGAKTCPGQDCKQVISKDADKDSDKELRNKSDQYASDRENLTNFFLDLVCQLFNGELPPSVEVLQILLSYVTQRTGNETTTSEMAPFPDSDAIDSSPIIRSFLLQLILNQNLAFVMEHIEAYLITARQHLHTEKSLKEFLWICICCAEDSFNWKSVRTCGFGREEAFIDFVLQNIPNSLERKTLQIVTALDIECLARCRFVLSSFADIVGKSETSLETDKIQTLNNRIERLITESEDNSLKILLLKLICLRYGVEFARKLFSTETLQWIIGAFPLGDDDFPDPFVVYGESYTNLKDFLYDSIFHNNVTTIEQRFQGLNLPNRDLIDFYVCCIVQQWVKSANMQNLTPQQRTMLSSIAEKISSGALRQTCDKVIAQSFWQSLVNASNSKPIASLAFHLYVSINYLPTAGIVTFFRTLLVTPDQLQGILFPTMPEDDFDQNMLQVLRTIGGSINQCPNGHPYLVGGKGVGGQCHLPMATDTCPKCKCPIGGTDHKFLPGNVALNVAVDKTKHGHCLGSITQLSGDILRERDLDRLSVAVCRLLLHCTMWLSSLERPAMIAALTDPVVSATEITNFCFNHINHDLDLLSRFLTVSRESVINLMHKLLNEWVFNKRGCHLEEQNLTTKQGRRLWENHFHAEILAPILPNASTLIMECDTLIANIGTQNKFYAQIYQNVQPDDYWSLFWSYRPPTSFESLLTKVLSQLDTEKDKKLLIMGEFLKRITYLNSLQYLQPILNLQKEMRIRLGSIVNLSEIRQMTIKQFLFSQTDGDRLKPLIESFFAALKIIEPKLNNLRFSLRTKEKVKEGNKTVTRIVPIEKWMVPNLNDPLNNSLTSILPLAFDQGFCSCALIDLLIGEQNEFTKFCTTILEVEDQVKCLDEVTSGHLINFDADRDVYPLLMLHRNFTYKTDSKMDVFFDLTRLNRRLEPFYDKDMTLYQYYVPLLKTRESILFDCLKHLRSNNAECDLSASQKRDILKTLTGKTYETKILLDTVENLIRFSASVDHYDEQVIIFAQKIHCLPTDSGLLKILNGLTLAHLPSLWQLVAYYSKYLRLGNSEDPFPEVNEKCKIDLSFDETEALLQNLRNIDLLQFLLETTEFSLLYLSLGASGLDRLKDTDQEITFAHDDIFDEDFGNYLIYRDECRLLDVEFDGCLKLKHSIGIWKFAAKRFAQTRLNV